MSLISECIKIGRNADQEGTQFEAVRKLYLKTLKRDYVPLHKCLYSFNMGMVDNGVLDYLYSPLWDGDPKLDLSTCVKKVSEGIY